MSIISKRMEAELGKFETLYSQLHSSNTAANQKNWDRINQQFTERLQNEAQIKSDFGKLSLGNQQAAFPDYQFFQQKAAEHKFNILGRMIATGSIQIAKVPSKSSLPTRIFNSLYNHKGKIAFAASLLIIANQTTAGTKLLSSAGQMVLKHSGTLWNPVKKFALQSVEKIAQIASNHLPTMGSALSAMWAIPAAYRAGFSKKGAAILLAGTASAIAPHVLQPGISWQGAWENIKNLGTTAIAAVPRVFHWEL